MKPNDFNLRDADLLETKALPAAESTSVVTDPIDTGERTERGRLLSTAAALRVPALPVGVLPNGVTATLVIESDTAVGFGTPTTLGSKVLTGAGGAGAGADELQITLPGDCERYVRGKVTFGAGAVDGSALTCEFSLRRFGGV